MSIELIVGLVAGLIFVVVMYKLVYWLLSLRTVVQTNEVHIVQGKTTVSYGRGEKNSGNTYMNWPSWMPWIGVQVTKLPLATFEVPLKDYLAYDLDKVPFVVDISAFLRVVDSNVAAQNISTIQDFQNQMKSVVQGAVRAVLSSDTIHNILVDRKELSGKFTSEVQNHLKSWGVETAKNIEFMDIRDSENSNVIETIRAEKVSEIDKNSRIKVAENNKLADIAEIEAKRETNLKTEEAKQQVGIREAQVAQEVGIAKEKSQQEIQSQAKVTAEKQVEVTKVQMVGNADISKATNIIKAEEVARVQVLAAEATKTTTQTLAEADKSKVEMASEAALTAKKNEAEGVTAIGKANAEAIAAKGLAEVQPQITLAQEIGENKGYQEYLVQIRVVEKDQAVGIAQADALSKADLKIISNAGDISGGITNIGEAFSSKGGTNLGAMVEGFINTPTGAAILNKVLGGSDASSVAAAATKATTKTK